MKQKYIIFLRGINVGGHHKVPMAELKKELKQLGFENIITILNSGNIILDAKVDSSEVLEKTIETHIENHFGFPIPTIVRKADEIEALHQSNPFEGMELTKTIRWYISFLKNEVEGDVVLPWVSANKSYQILEKRGKDILSCLDISVTKTPKAMKALEEFYGKNITTRNWNTINRIMKKLG